MKSLPNNLIAAKNRLIHSGGAWVSLFDVNFNGSHYYYTDNNEDVEYGGQTYSAYDIVFDGLVETSEGSLPQMQLRISNIARVLESSLLATNGGQNTTVTITYVNTDYLDEDYSDIQISLDVDKVVTDDTWAYFTLGVAKNLRRAFPFNRFNPTYCSNVFNDRLCNYGTTPDTIVDVTLSGTDPVNIEVTGHGYATGDVILLATVNGITGDIEGAWTITYVGVNNFTLDSSDSSDYGGAYTSGGTSGYYTCRNTLLDCRKRHAANAIKFRGFPGIRQATVRIA